MGLFANIKISVSRLQNSSFILVFLCRFNLNPKKSNPKKMIQNKMIQQLNPKMLNPKKMIQELNPKILNPKKMIHKIGIQMQSGKLWTKNKIILHKITQNKRSVFVLYIAVMIAVQK